MGIIYKMSVKNNFLFLTEKALYFGLPYIRMTGDESIVAHDRPPDDKRIVVTVKANGTYISSLRFYIGENKQNKKFSYRLFRLGQEYGVWLRTKGFRFL